MRRVQTISRHLLAAPSARTLSAAAALKGHFEGQVAVITGSGQGIGRDAALLFAREGAAVVVSDLDANKSDSVAKEIIASGGRALSFPGDVTDPTYPDRILKEAIGTFGKVTVVVNNAGYTWDGVIHKMTDKQWDAMISVHLTAVFRMVRACATHLRDANKAILERGGVPEQRVIINVSSVSGTHGNAGQINYSAAKAGIIGLTKTVAKEWGPFNIRCNAVAFGRINTRLTADKSLGASITTSTGEKVALGIPGSAQANYDAVPLKRAGNADEAAAAIALMASPWASYVTGQTLEVTGGALL